MTRTIIISLYLAFCLVLLYSLHERVNPSRDKRFSTNRDVYFIYQDATALSQGINPYARISGHNLTENQKYTFYLPGFLLAAASSIKLGLNDYHQWMKSWLSVSMLFHIGIGVLLFLLLYKKDENLLLPIIGSSFWLFSRWPLALFRSGQIDAVPIFFMLLCMVLWGRNRRLAFISLGISLSIKQMAVFLVPLFLLWAWNEAAPNRRFVELKGYLIALLAIPIALSLPFIIWDPESYLKMLVFPLTRDPVGARSAELAFQLPSILFKLPFFVMLAGIYWLAFRNQISKYGALLLVMISFLAFNSVFFTRYFCWAMPLIPLACLPWLKPPVQTEKIV